MIEGELIILRMQITDISKLLFFIAVFVILFVINLSAIKGQSGTCTNPEPLVYLIPSGVKSTCDAMSDFNQSDACSNTFINGEDFVFSYTPGGSNPNCIRITLNPILFPPGDMARGVFVFDGCPDTAGTKCIGQGITADLTSTQNVIIENIFVPPGQTYFIVVSSRDSCHSFNITIGPDTCSSSAKPGTDCTTPFPVSSIPFSHANTTCGAGNNYNEGNVTCLGRYMNGEDFVFEFTPDTFACFRMTLKDYDGFAGLFVLDGCPSDPGTNCIAYNADTLFLNDLLDLSLKDSIKIPSVALDSGVTYYILISTDISSAVCTPFHLGIKATPCCNFGFNDGFEGWDAYTGVCCPISAPVEGYVNTRHRIVSSADTDDWIIPTVAPGNEPFSALLGNQSVGSKAERLVHEILITDSLLGFNYAVVLQDPGHTAVDQPRFEVNITDYKGETIPCGSVSFVPGVNTPGFIKSGDVVYKAWSTAIFDVKDYIGQILRIDLRTGDCGQGAHYGYAYVDGICTEFFVDSYFCPGYDSVVFYAPPGFWRYNWSNGDTTQHTVLYNLNKDSALSVTLTPSPGLGCPVEIPVFLKSHPGITVNAGPDDTLCYWETYPLSADTTGTGTFRWLSSGTGNFDHDTSFSAIYTPSAKDIDAGKVDLIFYGFTPKECYAYDTLTLFINGPFYSYPKSNYCKTDSNPIPFIKNGNTGTFTASPSDLVFANAYTGEVDLSLTPPGTYQVTFLIDDICSADSTVVLTIHPIPAAELSIVENNSCTDSCGASIEAIAIAGISPFKYNWSHSGVGPAILNAVCPGIYEVEIIDANSCSAKVRDTVFYTPENFSLTIDTLVHPTCYESNNGFAAVNILSGGNAPFIYSWEPNGGSNAIAVNLAAGSYTCKVSDFNGCKDSINITIDNPLPISSSVTITDQTCSSLGSATVFDISGGTAPYSYFWSPSGGNAATATGLIEGNYSCTIMDINGCVRIDSVSITYPDSFTADIISNDATCNNSDGSASVVNVAGGTSPYSYLWLHNEDTSSSLNNLEPGQYICKITDSNGCSRNFPVSIENPSALDITVSALKNPDCNDSNNGAASVVVSGGIAPYEYLWDDANAQDSATAIHLGEGSYTVSVTDANNCLHSKTILITNPDPISVNLNVKNIPCFNNNNGSVSILTSGGTPPYSYNWTHTATDTSFIDHLSPGVYTCTISDNNGCIKNTSVTISSPPALHTEIVSQKNLKCYGDNDGSATVKVSGGTSPYYFQWDNPASQKSETAVDLKAGTYRVSVTDSNGCIKIDSTTITQPHAIAAEIKSEDAICRNNNGKAFVEKLIGGIPPYSYLWLPTGGNTSSINNLAPGTYTCTITDSIGCSEEYTVNIDSPGAFNIILQSQKDVTCNGMANGEVTVTVEGGTAPFTYLWSPSGGSANKEDSLNGGNYTVSVTDGTGCTETKSITIFEPTALTLLTSPGDSICAGNSATISANVNGGTPPYNYNWFPGAMTTSSVTVSPSSTLTYTVDVKDANNCSAPGGSATISVFAKPVANFTMTLPQAAFLLSPVYFNDQSTGAAHWLWNFGDILNSSSTVKNPSFTYSELGTYTITLMVTSDYGCTDIDSQTVYIESDYTVYIPKAFTPDGDGLNDFFILKGTGIDDFEMAIYNRWGERIYETANIEKPWNGRFKNTAEICKQDVYIYQLWLKDAKGIRHEYVGDVTLIR